jgi:hypothetical protein
VSGDLRDSGPGRVPGARTAPGTGHTAHDGGRFALLAATVLLVGAAQPALAANVLNPFVTAGYEYDSNVFMRPSSIPAFAAEGITALGDSILDYEVGLNSVLNLGADQLTLEASGTHDQYHRFSFLSHNEYAVDANLRWHLTRIVDGTVTYEQHRYMPPFTYTLTTALLLDTDRTLEVPIHVLVMPEWRLDLTAELDQDTTPVPGFADFKLFDKTGVVGLDYLGFGRLTAGLQFSDGDGRYDGIAAATRYQQREFDLTANYKVSGFSKFTASAGYTNRNSEADPADSVQAPVGADAFAFYAGSVGKTSGATGALSYSRQFTGKTSATLSIFRSVDSYAAGANPELSTGGTVGVTWKADPKFTLAFNYTLTRDQIKGGLIVLNTVNLADRSQTTEFEVRYLALSWLTLRPYVNWAKATSTFVLGNYSATIVGVDVTGRLQW